MTADVMSAVKDAMDPIERAKAIDAPHRGADQAGAAGPAGQDHRDLRDAGREVLRDVHLDGAARRPPGLRPAPVHRRVRRRGRQLGVAAAHWRLLLHAGLRRARRQAGRARGGQRALPPEAVPQGEPGRRQRGGFRLHPRLSGPHLPPPDLVLHGVRGEPADAVRRRPERVADQDDGGPGARGPGDGAEVRRAHQGAGQHDEELPGQAGGDEAAAARRREAAGRSGPSEVHRCGPAAQGRLRNRARADRQGLRRE